MAKKGGNPQGLTMAGQGRKKGVPNKYTQLKQDALKAFHHNGGWEAFALWGKKPANQAAFYKIIFSLVPKDVKLEASIAHSYDPATIQELGGLLREARDVESRVVGATVESLDEDRPVLPA